ncbi:hypothetical protein F5Y18DRAFT_428004 [Xylariaceae sp. FL1019]|nr:hypothetical protein F5Y18DRAFT_428004 [Xylariaceae sp. FL1019]
MFNFWPFSGYSARFRDSPSDSIEHDTDWDVDESDPEDQRRVVFGNTSTTIYGHPSTGGVLVLSPCNAVELDFLGLDRFEHAKRSLDTKEEDHHCAQMRKLGARWFRNMYHYRMMPHFEPLKFRRVKVVVTAWPENDPGVWVLPLRDSDDAGSEGVGRVWNAVSMEERCEVIKRLDGTYYADPALCPDLHLLKDDDGVNDGYLLDRPRQLKSVPTIAQYAIECSMYDSDSFGPGLDE